MEKNKQERRDFLKAGAAFSAATVFAPAIVKAQNFPSKPVQLIVPFKPGGGSDRTFRLFAPHLQKELGVPVNIRNIAGGGGWVAWQQMAKWDPNKDDHILGTLNFPHMFSYLDPRMKRSETTDSFNFIAWHSLDPCIWAIRDNETRFHDLKSFIEYVQKNPNQVIMSTTAVGSDDHMGIAFAEKFIPNFKVRKVYANSDKKKINEVINETTDAVAGNVGFYVPFMLEKQLKPICVLHSERYEALPSIRTFEEVTGKKNISFAGRTIVCAPGLSAEKKGIYETAIQRAITNPEYLAKEAKNKNNIHYIKGDELKQKIAETKKYVESVKFWEQKT